MANLLAAIKQTFPKALCRTPLAPWTTFGIGGQALGYLPVKTPEELMAAVKTARRRRLPYLVIAGGSNVVFADKPYQGIVFHYHNPRGIIADTGRVVVADAGVPLASLIERAISRGLAGLEALSGIPGTVGGAVVGNAGAYGQSISDTLVSVQIWDGRQQRWLSKKSGRFQYRDSIFKHKSWLVLRAKFRLRVGDKSELGRKSAEIIAVREKKYRPGLPCPGSFFKNILASNVSKKSLALIDKSKIIKGKIPAGYLLESVGAKGMKVGGVRIADFHGNLLINDGAATYRDVCLLSRRLKRLVKKRFGITLEEEVRFML